MLFCVETFSQPRAQVPPLRHDTSCDLSSNSGHHRCPEWQKHSSMLTFRRFPIPRHMTFVGDVRCMCPTSTETPESEWRWGSRLYSKDQKEALLSSPQQTNPFDCESATGERSTRTTKIRDFLQDIHDCWFLIGLQCNLTIMSQTLQISSTLLYHPIKNCSLQMAPREQTPCEWHGLSKPGSLLTPFLADLA